MTVIHIMDIQRKEGTKAVEILEGGRAANYTLMILCLIEGIDFAKVIAGLAETIEYLQFWAESDQFLYATWT